MSLYIQKAFNITKNNIIIAQPLVIFMLIITLTTAALTQQTNKIAYIIFAAANVLLCTAFFAGWFYMIKKAVEHNKKVENNEYKDDKEAADASFALGKEFFPGVGEYFLPMTFTIIAYVVVYALILFFSYKSGLRFLPHPHINWSEFMTAANSTPMEMQKYVMTLSFDQLKAINLWMLFLGGAASVFAFLTMYLFPAVYDKKEFFVLTPFSAFNRNLIFVFKNFLGSFAIIVFLFFLNMFLSILSIFFSINIILSIAGLIISFYFMTYAVVLIFLYYEEKK